MMGQDVLLEVRALQQRVVIAKGLFMDDLAELQNSAQDGNAVHAMVNSKGWTKVVRPALEARAQYLVSEFSNATEYEQFVRIQQSINAINGVLSFIEVTLVQGKEALQELKENS